MGLFSSVKKCSLLSKIGKCSLEIYVAHFFFITIVKHMLASYLNYYVYVILGTVLCVAFPIIMTILMKKMNIHMLAFKPFTYLKVKK